MQGTSRKTNVLKVFSDISTHGQLSTEISASQFCSSSALVDYQVVSHFLRLTIFTVIVHNNEHIEDTRDHLDHLDHLDLS